MLDSEENIKNLEKYFCLFGFSFHSTGIEIRELGAIAENEMSHALNILLQESFIHEAFIISTCNRLEICVVISDLDDIKIKLGNSFAKIKQNVSKDFIDNFYFYFHEDVCKHLIKVAAGLDSMILGEPQIFGQIKQGYEIGKQNGSIKTYLSKCLDIVIKAAKRIRTETEIAKGAIGIPSAAVELAQKTFKNLNNKKILLLGAGKMGSITAKHFDKKGISHIYITNRSIEKSLELANQLNAKVIDWSNFKNFISDVDIIIASTSSTSYILNQEDLAHILKPIIIIDISVPRNINPNIQNLENIFLYDIDSLKQININSEEKRRLEIPKAIQILEEENLNFQNWLSKLKVRSVIKDLKESFNINIEDEINRNKNALDDNQIQCLKKSLENITAKILKQPIIKLNDFSQDDEHGDFKINIVKEIFNLK